MQVPLELAIGWSTGYGFATAKNKENEVKQGKNYYQASVCQAYQVCHLSSVVNTLGNNLPNLYIKTAVKIGSTGASVLGFVFCPTFAAVKQGHYEIGVKTLNEVTRPNFPKLADRLPEKLSKRTNVLYSYLAEHSGDIASSAMIVGTAALPIFGNVYFAGAMLAPIAYQAIDSRNWVPRKISLFMENYMPTVASAAYLFGSNPVFQVGSAMYLSTFSPTFNQFIHRKLDNMARNYFHLKGPSIEEIDAPLIVNKGLSYDQINSILNCNDPSRFTINPAHCSKWACGEKTFAKNDDFSRFLELFKRIDWSRNYSLLKKAFKDDDRFLDFLKEKFPQKEDTSEKDQLEDFQKNFDSYVTELANSSLKTKEQYLADQLEKQMIHLVKVLKGEARAKGSQRDTDEAIGNCAQILGHLLQLNWDINCEKIEIEDAILKLAVEGGEYCARGVKRASREIVNGILLAAGKSDDPQDNYEFQLRINLEQLRTNIMTDTYQYYIDNFVKNVKTSVKSDTEIKETTDQHAVALAQDVHTLDIYRLAFALGVVPLTEYERNSIGFNELNLWGSPGYPFRKFRMDMYHTYLQRLDESVKELGAFNFFTYILAVIQTNPQLNKVQKDALVDESQGVSWSAEETQRRFNRLAFVMLGILKYDALSDDWIEMTIEDESSKGESTAKHEEDHDWILIEQEEEDFSDWTPIDNEEKRQIL